ncbi:MAG: RNA methyltransferase [Patescibacteria group bacterium]|nr:RNA methyltransferase [Patescibacteria group bacterium]
MSRDFVLVLDNIRSLYNVGSMFRSADGFGVKKIYLCGITGTPEQHGVQKVALGAEKSVSWEHRARTWAVVEELKRQGYFVVGLEKVPGAISLHDFKPPKNKSLALVVGNEIRGLTPALQRRLDAVVYIPMSGVKQSFNVAVAAGVAMYELASLHKRGFRHSGESRNPESI